MSPLGAGLLDAAARLARLMDDPADARFLAPLVTREIVERLRRDFAKPLCIGEAAREVGMSVPGFHHHFKAMTAISPLQHRKQLRLHEARRLMVGEEFDVASPARPARSDPRR